MATKDQKSGKTSAIAYARDHAGRCVDVRAAPSSAIAVQPVRTWCANSHGWALVRRKAMMAPMRSTYSDHAADHHRRSRRRYREYRYQQRAAVPVVTTDWSTAAWSSVAAPLSSVIRRTVTPGVTRLVPYI